MKTQKKRIATVGLAVVGGAAALYAAATIAQANDAATPDLLDSARVVTDASGWAMHVTYACSGSGIVTGVQSTPGTPPRVPWPPAAYPGSYGGPQGAPPRMGSGNPFRYAPPQQAITPPEPILEPFRLDTAQATVTVTHRRIGMRPRILGSPGNYYESASAPFVSLSPDGRWAIAALSNSGTTEHLDLLDLQSPNAPPTPLPFQARHNRRFAWTPDGSHCATITTGTPVGGVSPATLHILALPSMETQDRPAPTGIFTAFRGTSVVTMPNDHTVCSAAVLSGSDITVSTWDVSGRAQSLSCATVTLDPGVRIQSLALAPQGNRVAWLQQTISTPFWARLFPRLFSRNPVYTRRVALWVADSNGGHRRELGVISAQDGSDGVPYGAFPEMDDDPNQLHWSSDGRQITLVRDSTLYAVAVP